MSDGGGRKRGGPCNYHHQCLSLCRYLRVYPVSNPEKLNLEQAKVIVKLRTVQPEGLNPSLEFHCREDWYEFAAWCREHRTKVATLTNETLI